MATTTNFGWDTPDDTDLVKDGAAAIRTALNGVDTSFVDLKGGTTGQILSKNSNTDLDYTWITNDVGDITEVAAGTGISGGGTSGSVTITNSMATEIDAKGDLIGGTGADAFARLAIGTNGQVLTADSVETTGMKWATPSPAAFVGCSLGRSANQTMSNNTVNEVLWTTEAIDTDAFHSTVTNTGRLTIPSGKDGKYLIILSLNWASNSTGVRDIFFKKNGSDYSPSISTTLPGLSGGAMTMNLSTIVSLVATDYITAHIYQNSGGNLDATSDRTFIYLQYLGA
jgi:hypothetical protein